MKKNFHKGPVFSPPLYQRQNQLKNLFFNCNRNAPIKLGGLNLSQQDLDSLHYPKNLTKTLDLDTSKTLF